MAVVFGVRLPPVDKPGLDLQLIGGEELNARAVEKPRRVRGNIRRLVSPVIEVVVAEQTDVGDENSSVYVQAVKQVKVVPAVSFRGVLVGAAEVPLANAKAGVIARRGGGEHAEHEQDSAAHVLPVKIAAHAGLLDLDFAGTE